MTNPATDYIVTKYYFAGATRIAMRTYDIPAASTLKYLLGDHLGSTSLTTDASGVVEVETLYKPCPYGMLREGEVRSSTPGALPTRYTYTGQYSYVSDQATGLDDEAGFGLMFYNARWYDGALGRMIQADSVVPGGMQGLDRYAYANNSPLRYVDDDGHKPRPPHHHDHHDIPLPERDTSLSVILSENKKNAPDLTNWLLNAMQENASGPTATAIANANSYGDKLNAYTAWYNSVKADAPWDFKVELNKWGIDKIILVDTKYRFDVLANIHYGYVGRAAGFSAWELQYGAGLAQQFAGRSSPDYYPIYYDDPLDNYMVRVGIWLYDHYHDEELTPEMLAEAFEKVPFISPRHQKFGTRFAISK